DRRKGLGRPEITVEAGSASRGGSVDQPAQPADRGPAIALCDLSGRSHRGSSQKVRRRRPADPSSGGRQPVPRTGASVCRPAAK
ncbi:hypothetical protein ABTI03_19320, partial [Acinetobacter baumannii]